MTSYMLRINKEMNNPESRVDNKISSTGMGFFHKNSDAAAANAQQTATLIAAKQSSTTENPYDLLCATANMLKNLGTALVQLNERNSAAGSTAKVNYDKVSKDVAAAKLNVLLTPQRVEEELAQKVHGISPSNG
jgi:hypothetical protein